MKTTSSLILALSLGFTFNVEAKSTVHRTEAAKPMAVASANSMKAMPRPNEAEITLWKNTISDSSGKISLKDKIRALVKLAEIEGKDVSAFLAARKAQLDANIKSAGFSNDRENVGFKAAVSRVIISRAQIRVAENN